jgi:hypothetical protein
MPDVAGVQAQDDIRRRVERLGRQAGFQGAGELLPDPLAPRWRTDAKVVEFECGCRAVRTPHLYARPQEWDPIIFCGLPQQAVYEHCCDRHLAGMNLRCTFGRFVDFDQWKRTRFHVLTGRTKGARR